MNRNQIKWTCYNHKQQFNNTVLNVVLSLLFWTHCTKNHMTSKNLEKYVIIHSIETMKLLYEYNLLFEYLFDHEYDVKWSTNWLTVQESNDLINIAIKK